MATTAKSGARKATPKAPVATAEKSVKKAARVLCQGSLENTDTRYEYDGPMDCLTADRLGGGPKSCAYGCIGLGSCTSVCKFGAIEFYEIIIIGVLVVERFKYLGCIVCRIFCVLISK